MKKYPITFADDYDKSRDQYPPDIKLSYSEHYHIYGKEEEIALCRKWRGKKITLAQLEKYIDEFDRIIFDGEEIMIYNNYVE